MTRHDKVMTISRADFIRTLRQFCRRHGHSLAATGPAWRIRTAHGVAEITIHELPALRIAALSLPRHAVRIDLPDFSEAARAAFLSAFETSFHRGGG